MQAYRPLVDTASMIGWRGGRGGKGGPEERRMMFELCWRGCRYLLAGSSSAGMLLHHDWLVSLILLLSRSKPSTLLALFSTPSHRLSNHFYRAASWPDCADSCAFPQEVAMACRAAMLTFRFEVVPPRSHEPRVAVDIDERGQRSLRGPPQRHLVQHAADVGSVRADDDTAARHGIPHGQ